MCLEVVVRMCARSSFIRPLVAIQMNSMLQQVINTDPIAALVSSKRVLRLFYDNATKRLDPAGDERLAELHQGVDPVSAFDAKRDLGAYIAGVTRPYVRCTLLGRTDTRDVVALTFARAAQSRELDPTPPFDPLSDSTRGAVTLFDDSMLVPVLRGTVIAFEMKTPRSASGRMEFRIAAPQ